jgi:hypothetical protein
MRHEYDAITFINYYNPYPILGGKPDRTAAGTKTA